MAHTDLLAVLAKKRTEADDAVSRFLHFQRLTPPKMAVYPAPHGKRQ